MDYYNTLQNNDEFNNYSNNLQPLQMDHTSNNNVNSSCDYYDFSITSNNNIPTSYMTNNYEQQQSLFSSINNENQTTTTQSFSYEPQYTSHTSHDSHITSPLNSLNMITNSSQINRSDIFKFEIPGFKIVVIPTSSTISSSYANLNNFDTQNQVHTSPIVDSHNSQNQFNNFHN
ncbi:hypothetical protein C1646_749104 [Rhizophagus diaphanus]|nr:hypothetical protein C1646_749104 [Rhizophagus diaphanus] [Rhizophagus sp. MUCL 43196]